MEHPAGDQKLQADDKNLQKPVGDYPADKQRSCPHRRRPKAPQDILFAKKDNLKAHAPETASKNRQHYHRTHQEAHLLRISLGEEETIDEQKQDRENDRKENGAAVANQQLETHNGEVVDAFQSRRLLPVSSMNTSSSEGLSRWTWMTSLFSAINIRIRAIRVRGASRLRILYPPSLGVTSSAQSRAWRRVKSTGERGMNSMRLHCRDCSMSARGVPEAMILPRSTIATRSQSCSASSM